MIPEQVGRYEIKSQLGQGGMASVYRAFDPHFKRDVAIKILPRQLMLDDPQFRTRFIREAETIAALEHPAIVQVYDFGEEDGQPYLVMRLMSGGSLDGRIKQGALPTLEAARILERIGSALDRAHDHGIIHRDLKPGNILFDQYGDAFLADFGIVRLTQQGETLTATGGIVGTPAYMSPEQIQGNQLDGRSDIYALGIIVFEMLTGQKPFKANTPAMMLVKQMTEPLPPVLDVKPDLPPACEEVISRATAKEVEQRYGRASEMADTLNTALHSGLAATRKTPVPEPTIPTPPQNIPDPVTVPTPIDEETAVSTTSSTKFSRRTLLLGLLAIFLFVISGVALFLVLSNNNVATAPLPATDAQQLIPMHQLGRGNIETAELSPDGQKLAVGGSTGTWIYDAHTLEPEALLQGHSDIVRAVAWSPDGAKIASAGWDNRIKLWDLATNEQIGTIEAEDQFLAVAWSPDGSKIVATTWGSPIMLFDSETTRFVGELVGHENSVHHLRFSPNGQWLASADDSEQAIIRLWNFESEEAIMAFPAHEGNIASLVWSPDSTQLASVGLDDSIVRVWHVAGNQEEILYELAGHEYGAYDVALAPDGSEIVTSGGNDLLMVWDAENGRNTGQLLETNNPVIRIIPLNDSNQYLLIQANGTILIVNATNGNVEHRQQEHTAEMQQVVWSPDDQIAATANGDGTIRLWAKETGEQIAHWQAHEYGVTTLVWTPDGDKIISAGEDGVVRLWEINTQEAINEWQHPDGSVSSLALSPDGNTLAVADWGGFMWLIDTELKNIIHEWQAHDDAITKVAWSPDNQHIASSSADKVVTIWNIEDIEDALFLDKQEDLVSDVAWSPDGTQLATTSHDFSVRVWEVASGAELWRERHLELASAIAWSPNGNWIASGGWDQVIRLWDATDGTAIAELEGHVGPVTTLDWTADGNALVSGSKDGTAIIWETNE